MSLQGDQIMLSYENLAKIIKDEFNEYKELMC